jgi:hypothetical protein
MRGEGQSGGGRVDSSVGGWVKGPVVCVLGFVLMGWVVVLYIYGPFLFTCG